MQAKHETTIKNNRSVINHQFVTSDVTSIIAVYGHDNSRTIYIESGNQEKRAMTKYQILFPKGSYASDAANGWSISTPSISLETATEIRELRKVAQTIEEYQVTNDEMKSFKATMDKAAKETLILNGEQDYDIQTGLKAIGKDIKFYPSNQGGCTIQ